MTEVLKNPLTSETTADEQPAEKNQQSELLKRVNGTIELIDQELVKANDQLTRLTDSSIGATLLEKKMQYLSKLRMFFESKKQTLDSSMAIADDKLKKLSTQVDQYEEQALKLLFEENDSGPEESHKKITPTHKSKRRKNRAAAAKPVESGDEPETAEEFPQEVTKTSVEATIPGKALPTNSVNVSAKPPEEESIVEKQEAVDVILEKEPKTVSVENKLTADEFLKQSGLEIGKKYKIENGDKVVIKSCEHIVNKFFKIDGIFIKYVTPPSRAETWDKSKKTPEDYRNWELVTEVSPEQTVNEEVPEFTSEQLSKFFPYFKEVLDKLEKSDLDEITMTFNQLENQGAYELGKLEVWVDLPYPYEDKSNFANQLMSGLLAEIDWDNLKADFAGQFKKDLTKGMLGSAANYLWAIYHFNDIRQQSEVKDGLLPESPSKPSEKNVANKQEVVKAPRVNIAETPQTIIEKPETGTWDFERQLDDLTLVIITRQGPKALKEVIGLAKDGSDLFEPDLLLYYFMLKLSELKSQDSEGAEAMSKFYQTAKDNIERIKFKYKTELATNPNNLDLYI